MQGPAGWVLGQATLSLTVVGAALLALALLVEKFILPRAGPSGLLFLETSGVLGAVLLVATFGGSGTQDFLYFQF